MDEHPDFISLTTALITIFDDTGNCVSCNNSWRDFIGINTTNVQMSLWLSYINQDDVPSVKETIKKGVSSHNSFNIQFRLYNLEDQDFHWVDTHFVPYFNSYGIFSGMLATAQDINTSKLLVNALERALHLRNAELKRFRTILESASDGIHIIDSSGKLIQFSDSFQEMLGYTHDEMEQLYVYDWDVGLERTEIENILSLVFEETRIIQSRHKRKNGDVFDVEIHTKGIILDGVTYHYASARDITLRKRSEDQLRHAHELAEYNIRIKSEFLASISHEFKTPLNGIIGLLELAKQEIQSLNQGKTIQISHYLHKALYSAEMLLNLIQDVLDFTSLEAGNLELRMEEFHISNIINSLTSQFSESAKTKGLIFEVDISPSFDYIIYGDRVRLRQILSHITSNAIKFTEHGKVKVHFDYQELNQKTIQLNISVSDTGIGIEETLIDKIFLPFMQSDGSATRRAQGCGIGLSIANRLLTQMGSKLNVISKLGEGSIFSFNIKFAKRGSLKDDFKPQSITEIVDNELNINNILSGKEILVVEDNEINQLVISKMLNMFGAKVHLANNGREALQCLEESTYSAVLMDLHMPVMGGIEATQLIRDQLGMKKIPIIALTAGDPIEEKEKCLSSGMNAFISKPIKQKNLAEAIAKLILES